MPVPSAIRILVVDDNADTTMLLEFALKRRGREVVTAASVAQALALAKSQRFDLLVSDIGLTDGSGLDLMREIRGIGGTDAPHGIALSGRGASDDVEESKSAGFDVHLVKPVSLDLLEAAVNRLIAQ